MGGGEAPPRAAPAPLIPAEAWQLAAVVCAVCAAASRATLHVVGEAARRAAFALAALLPGVDGEVLYNLPFVRRWADDTLDVLDGSGRPSASIRWYTGTVRHTRLPRGGAGDGDARVAHAFTHQTRMAMVSLDAPPRWFAADSARGRTGAPWMRPAEVLEMLGLGAGAGAGAYEVWLLCMPAAASYMINPIAVYYCFERRGGRGPRRLFPQAVAEVTSEPWEDRVRFVFGVRSGECIPKCLHVSPFYDVEGRFWRLRTAVDGEMSRITLSVDLLQGGPGDAAPAADAGGPRAIFTASLALAVDGYQCRVEKLLAVTEAPAAAAGGASARRMLAATGSLSTMLRRGFHPHRACCAIYYNALLLLVKGAALRSHPQSERLAAIADGHNDAVRRRRTGPPSGCAMEKLPRPPWPWGVY